MGSTYPFENQIGYEDVSFKRQLIAVDKDTPTGHLNSIIIFGGKISFWRFDMFVIHRRHFYSLFGGNILLVIAPILHNL